MASDSLLVSTDYSTAAALGERLKALLAPEHHPLVDRFAELVAGERAAQADLVLDAVFAHFPGLKPAFILAHQHVLVRGRSAGGMKDCGCFDQVERPGGRS